MLTVGLLSFLLGCGPRKSPFEKRGAEWHFQGVRLTEVEDATFEPLDDYFGRDARQAYYCTTDRRAKELFTVKRARGVALSGVAPGDFRVLRNRYARDSKRIFFEETPFPVQDLASFEVLEYLFARDRQTGYYARQPVPGSDGPSFAGLDSHYARDKAAVYHGDIVPERESSRVVITRLSGADPASFTPLDDGYARDAGQAYYRGRVLTKEAASFTVLSYGYAKNNAQVYYLGQPVAGADAASFAVLVPPTAEANAKDANAEYSMGSRLRR